MARETFTNVYNTTIATIYGSSAAQRRLIHDLTKAEEIKELVSLIYKAISKFQDIENRLVELKGV